MFTVSKNFAHIECYSDCLHMGAIWLNPFDLATMLFNVCLVYFLLCKEEGSSPVSLQLQRGGL